MRVNLLEIFLLASLAKANDNYNKPWLFSGIYAIFILVEKLLVQSAAITPNPNYLPMLIMSLILSFIIAGVLFFLLNRFQDTIFTWLIIFITGVILLVLVY